MRLLLILAALSAAAPVSAHVTVWPKQSTAGAHEKYEVRVPNEKQVDTVAIDVRVPAGLRIASVEQKPDWRTELVRDPSGTVTGIRWTGKLAPMQFTEFGLLAANPPNTGDLVWSATQLFADGSRVEWSGTAGSKTPAAHVTIVR